MIPVTPVAVAGADDGFQLVQADVAAFVADRLTHLALAAGERPRVEVLNGNGEILATRSVVDALVAPDSMSSRRTTPRTSSSKRPS